MLSFQIPLAPPAPHAEELNEPSPNKGGHMGFVVVIVVCGQQVHSCNFLVGLEPDYSSPRDAGGDVDHTLVDVKEVTAKELSACGDEE